jgi:hypothetical protein
MRADQDWPRQGRGLQHVVAAMGFQAAADEGDVAGRVKRLQLPRGIDDQASRAGRHRVPRAAQRHGKAGVAGQLGCPPEPFRAARRQHQQGVRVRFQQAREGLQQG